MNIEVEQTTAVSVCSYCLKDCGSPEGLGAHLLEGHPAVEAPPPQEQGPSEEELRSQPPDPIDGGLLTPEEERALAVTIRGGGPGAPEAKKRLVEKNLGLVGSIAKRYQGKGLPLEDVIQEGNLGLMRAADGFDPSLGFRFTTYAYWWIRQAIQRAFMNDARMVRVPVHIIAIAGKARRMIASGSSIEDVAEELGTSPQAVSDALTRTESHSVSMESGDRDGNGRHNLGSHLASPDEAPPPIDRSEMTRLLGSLSERHRKVLVRRFGLDGQGTADLSTLGKELGVSKERIRQLESHALKHLRQHCVKPAEDGSEDHELSLDAPALPPIRMMRRVSDFNFDPNKPAEEAPFIRKTPQPHQEEAIAAVLEEFRSKDRATAVMACGTGKTLVALWTFERLKGNTALILAPSLALLKQTLREWRGHGAAGRYLCVCSDETVRDDGETRFSAEELGIPVTTNPAEVSRWLRKDFHGKSLILSTYQSARVLGAGLPDGFWFDLAIFDEAHRTAGARDRNFSFGLLDRQVRAAKRLFMTATPSGAITDGSEESPFSMADETIYGRQVYELGLSDAITRGIICDYKVVIGVVTQAEVAAFFSGHAHVWPKGGAMSARDAAYHIAFARAVQECGAKKVITFHGGVGSADKFSRSRWLQEDLLPQGFRTYHVNGRMPAGLRHAILSKFASDDMSLVTNARCLNEGVDVPAVDMVAFMSPKKSRIDILQTIGRALRKAPDKTVGYVMLPVLVDDAGNPLSTAAEYRDLSEVLYSLRSQDGILERRMRLDSLRKGMGERQGRNALGGRLLFTGPEILPDVMKQAITAKVLTPMGSSWDEMFGRLVAFKKSHGTCLVPRAHADIQLSNWVAAQRASRRRERLSQRQMALLDSVGFPWNPKRTTWETMIAALGDWRAKNGHCNVTAHDGKLGGFVSNCRRERRLGRMKEERIRELDAMGFEWKLEEYKSDDDQWKERYLALKEFVGTHGIENFSKAPFDLRRWASTQRKRRERHSLEADRITLLDAIGFRWKVVERRLQKRYFTNRERRPVGAIVIRRQFANGRDVEERWIKVSDTGPQVKRWKLYARWWWEQNRGPVPPGKSVYHVNGKSLDDRPENLAVGGPGDRIRAAHLNNPEMSKRNSRTVHEGCAAWNRRQGLEFRFKNIVKSSWYPAIERLKVVINVPFRKRTNLFRAFGYDASRIPLSGHGPEVDRLIEESGILPVSSVQLHSEPFSSFARVDVELGLANPKAAGADAEVRMKMVMEMPLWRHAKAAAALDVHER